MPTSSGGVGCPYFAPLELRRARRTARGWKSFLIFLGGRTAGVLPPGVRWGAKIDEKARREPGANEPSPLSISNRHTHERHSNL